MNTKHTDYTGRNLFGNPCPKGSLADTDSGKAPSVKRYRTQARVTQFVNADNQLRFCVSIVNEGLIPHQDEGKVLGQYDNAKDAQLRAATYNNHGI